MFSKKPWKASNSTKLEKDGDLRGNTTKSKQDADGRSMKDRHGKRREAGKYRTAIKVVKKELWNGARIEAEG